MSWDIHALIVLGSLLMDHFKTANLKKQEIYISSLMLAYKRFDKENKF